MGRLSSHRCSAPLKSPHPPEIILRPLLDHWPIELLGRAFQSHRCAIGAQLELCNVYIAECCRLTRSYRDRLLCTSIHRRSRRMSQYKTLRTNVGIIASTVLGSWAYIAHDRRLVIVEPTNHTMVRRNFESNIDVRCDKVQ